MSTLASAPAPAPRTWIVSPTWDLTYVVLTPLLIVPAVLVAVRHWLSTEQVYLAVISFASLGHHLPGFMRAYGDRELFLRYRLRFLLAPPLVLGLALLFTPPTALAEALKLPWTHLHGLELILTIWGTWHGLMQTYGFMRIYDLRRGQNDRRVAQLDQALCVAIFVAGVVFSDTRMLGLATAMWQSGLPLFGPELLSDVRWVVGALTVAVLLAYGAFALVRRRRGMPINGVKLLLLGITGWFWWYCGRLSTNLLVGVAMFEIYHAVQYNAIVWIYNRRLLSRAGERFGPLGFLFSDRATMLGIYLGAIAAYSSIRFFTVQPADRMFGADPAGAHQWIVALFVASSLLHFYYDGFIWKVSERATRDNLVDNPAQAPPALERFVPGLLHGGKWALLAGCALLLVAAERRYRHPESQERLAAERSAIAALTPDVPEAAMFASQEALARGDADAAARFAERAAAARPGSHQAQAELAYALMAARNFKEAKAAITRAVALNPQHWVYQCDVGEIYEKLGDNRGAEAAYRRATELAPQEVEPWDRLSALLVQLGRLPDARAAVEKMLTLNDQLPAAHYRVGLIKIKQGDARGAVAPLRRAVKLDPKYFLGWLQLGDAMMALDKAPAAVVAYSRAVNLKPDAAAAWVCWADALVHSGQPREAEKVLRSGLAATPDSPELNLTLGVLLNGLGRPAEAAPFLHRAEELGLTTTGVQ